MSSVKPTYLVCWLAVLLLASACGGCREHNWNLSFDYEGDEPYDLSGLVYLLKEREAGLEFVQDSLQTLDELEYGTGENYIYVGRSMFLNEADFTTLLNFVEQGNKAFVFVEGLPEELQYHLFSSDCFYGIDPSQVYYYDDVHNLMDTVTFDLVNKNLLPVGLSTTHIEDYEPSRRSWRAINPMAFCDRAYGTQKLGTVTPSGEANYMRRKYGDGEIYVHVEPLLFTNYYLWDSTRTKYAEAALSYANPGKFYWDEASRSYRPPPNPRNPYEADGGRQLLTDNHAFSYVLSQPGLTFGWYAFLLGLLLFLIFRAKRRQRVIPLLHPKQNSSLQYVDTLARLNQQNGNHYQLAKRELKLLRHFLQEHFQVRWREGKPPPQDLASRIGLPQTQIEQALVQIEQVQRQKYLDQDGLMAFYQSLQPIYRLVGKS
ncbi:MAG: DUF4350 domain-containing protein [Bacteroidota bacterium]